VFNLGYMKDTQKAMILNDLLLGTRLTGLDILTRYGCIKASNRISELVADGHNIQRRMIEIESAHGKKRVAEYWIEPKVEPKKPVLDFMKSTQFAIFI